MSKTSITVRLDDIVLQEIDSRCNTDYCRSDFIKNATSEALKSEKKTTPKAKITRISYDDGKTWIDLPQK